MNLFSASSNLSGDVCSTLFGSTSILTLSKSEVWLCAGLSVVVVAAFLLYYNKIFAVTFDEDFAKAVGTKADLYNLLLAVIVAVVIVLAMNLVGSLLISALVIFPALSAMRVFQSFRVGDGLLGRAVSKLRGAGDSCLHSRGDAGGFHHRGGGYSGIFGLFGPWPRKGRGNGMKRIFCLLLAACMAVSLCACGKAKRT